MSQTYSTANRDRGAGGLYSTRRQPRSAAPVAPRAVQRTAGPGAEQHAGAMAEPTRHAFALRHSGLPLARRLAPGVYGAVTLEGLPGEPHRVEGSLGGLPAIPDPAVRPTLWLLHDLTVPLDLDPADLSALPRGANGTGNQPGHVFTFDGNPPTYPGGDDRSNNLSLAVSPGVYLPTGPDSWRLEARLEPGVNRVFHPLIYAGPDSLADMNQGLPSGTAARILTDLFMRTQTVRPDLPVQSRFLDRLRAVAERHLVEAGPEEVLDSAAFTKAAVTVEGAVRATPVLMPTREACILLGSRADL